jgi:uncharacterized protein (DUF2225 family)
MSALEIERCRIRQLVHNVRLFGRSHSRLNEIRIAWVMYSALKKIERNKKYVVSLV